VLGATVKEDKVLRFRTALLMILFAAPAYAEGRFGGSFHGGGIHGRDFHGTFSAFHRGGRARFFVGYGYGYNCSLGFDCGRDDRDYGYGSGYSDNNGGTRNAVSSGSGFSGGYVPDPVGAEIPPLIIPTNCWVRRAAYDPSGAYFGQVLIDLCRSGGLTVTDLKSLAKTPGTGVGQPAIDHKTP
jgi:hypothetical protein